MPPPGRSQRIAEWARSWNAGLTRYLRRRLPGRIDPQDLAQEVYVRLLRLEQLEQVKEPQAYLYRVASNVAAEWRMRAVHAKPHSDTEKVTSWTERRLIFEDTSLSAAAAEFATYSSRSIRIEDATIGERKINGVFDATDPASLAEFLSADETLNVREDADGWTVSAR